MLIQKHIVHKRQIRNYNCGSAALAILLGKTQEETAFLCQTKTDGTHFFMVANALRKLGAKVHLVQINEDYLDYMSFMEALSHKWPLMVSGAFHYRKPKARGRDTVLRHAFAVADGFIYDTAQDSPIPVEAYAHIFTKRLILNELILVEEERPFFLHPQK